MEVFVIFTLKDLKPGQKACVGSIAVEGLMRRKLMDMGVTPGVEIEVNKTAPFGDPIEVRLRGYALSLRKKDAENILMVQ
ncbi:ferrous iron transport protein A [Acetobacterium fimetarium]|uniref:Ferrous iron transport protein A n=1 Tax=Acetobacterium fimetarium TaxID=52691 RepID=A0ABR6WTB1_9FIRM|nr:ferrous iron transport protein A [Acetobacterium fimetarium]